MSYSASKSGRRYGSIFSIRSPGRKPRRSPASTAGRVRMIRLTSWPRQRAGGHRHGQVRLARAGRADPEGDRLAADRVDVALLVDGLRRDLARAVASRRRPRGSSAGRSCWSSAEVTAPIVPGGISWPCAISSDSSRTTSRRAGDRLGLAVERHHVAAQEHVALEVALERAQDGVLGAAQLGRDLVGDLELAAHAQRSASCTSSLTRRPSARPATFAITADITLPISFGDAAPVSSTASATSARARRRRSPRAGRPRSSPPRPPRRRRARRGRPCGRPRRPRRGACARASGRDLALLVELAARLLGLLLERVEHEAQRGDRGPSHRPSSRW